MVTKILVFVFIVYIFQSVLAWIQLKQSYAIVNDVKAQHRGTGRRMVTGTGKTKFLLIARGYYIILVVDENDIIKDYYGMDGYTVFARPKQKEQYIGMSLDQMNTSFKKKNEKKAFENAVEQLFILREQEPAGGQPA